MADETLQTDATNSSPETQTEPPVQTDTGSSNTDPTAADPPTDDPLADAPDGLGADPTGDEGSPDSEGEPQGDPKDEGEPDPTAALFGAPEGEYELTLPEGVTVDAEALAAFEPTARELNLSNEGLVKLVEKGLPVVEGQVHKGLVQSVIAQRKGWETDTTRMIAGYTADDGQAVAPDPLFGGSNSKEVMQVAATAIDKLTTDAAGQPRQFPGANADGSAGTFRDFLKSTGLGNHPAMVQAFYLVGKAVAEDNDFVRHGDVPKAKPTLEEKFYPHKAT